MDAAVAKWHPLDPLLVSTPGSTRFLPVPHAAEYGAQAHRIVLRKHVRGIAILLLIACLLGISGYFAERPSAIRAAFMSLAVAAFAIIDHWLVIRSLERLRERALFTVWLHEKALACMLFPAAAMLGAGGLQLYAEWLLGSHDALLLEYGALSERIEHGEVWRLIVGPFIHAGPAHWFANLALLVVASAVVGPLLRARGIALFIAASTFGAAASFVFAAAVDVYVGVSAGIFGLMGWCAGAALRRAEAFPGGFAVTALAFALLNACVAWLALPDASNIGHVAGLLFGLACGLWLRSKRGRAGGGGAA